MKRMILASTALLLLSGPVVANPIEDARICAKGVEQPAESYLPYCTRAIQSSRLGRADLALTHNNRGAILQMLGREDEALGDFNRAIKFNPGLAWSYLNRGMIFVHREEFDAPGRTSTRRSRPTRVTARAMSIAAPST